MVVCECTETLTLMKIMYVAMLGCMGSAINHTNAFILTFKIKWDGPVISH